MFSLKELEALKKLSTVLCIPLFSTALIRNGLETKLLRSRDHVLQFLQASHSVVAHILERGLLLIFSTVIAAVAFFIFDWIAIWLDVRLEGLYVSFWLALVFFTEGLLLLAPTLLAHTAIGVPHPVWGLACLAYGFTLLERHSRFSTP